MWEFDGRPLVRRPSARFKFVQVIEVRRQSSLGSLCAATRFLHGLSCDPVVVEYPCESLSVWGSRCGSGVVRAPPYGLCCVGALFRAGAGTAPVYKGLDNSTRPWRAARLAGGLVLWHAAHVTMLGVLCVGALATVLAGATLSLVTAGLKFWAAFAFVAYFAIKWTTRAVAAEMVYDDASSYDEARGFFVPGPPARQRFRFPPSLAILASRAVALLLLVTASPDFTFGLVTAVVALTLPSLLRVSVGLVDDPVYYGAPSRPVAHSAADARAIRRDLVHYTRASLGELREHLLTPAGARDLGRLAAHPHSAAARDAEIRRFLKTGGVLHHDCHYRYADY